MRPIFDAHLDLAWNALHWNRDLRLPLEEMRHSEVAMQDHPARGHATLTVPELQQAQVHVCLSTVLVRSKPEVVPTAGYSRRDLDYRNQTHAHAVGMGQLAYYEALERQGWISLLKTSADLSMHWARACAPPTEPNKPADASEPPGPIQVSSSARGSAFAYGDDPPAPARPLGIILAMEGADPISHASEAQMWWDRGLRAVSLSHYAQGPYAPGTGVSNHLPDRGRALLREFARLGMIVDLSHCTEPAFFEVLDYFSGPVFASHNMCRQLVPGDRQFSDQQLTALLHRQAVIGMAFDAWMLKPGWRIGVTTPDSVSMSAVADHIDHICQMAGNAQQVGIGTDLDGGFGNEQSPIDLRRYVDVHRLADILSARNYSDRDIAGIFWENYLQFFLRHLPQT